MFCKNCGKPIADDKVLCDACEPSFQVGVPAEGKKKKGGGKLALILIALVLVAGVVLTALNWDGVTRLYLRNFGAPADYLADVEQDAIEDGMNRFAEAYDKTLNAYNPNGIRTQTSVTLEMSESLMGLLDTVLAYNDLDLDLDWVESISLSPLVEMYENTMRLDVGVGLNQVELVTVSCILDMESHNLYLGVPELNQTYIQMDARELLGRDGIESFQELITSRQTVQAIMEGLPSGAELEALVCRYTKLLLGELEEVEKDKETVRAGGLEQDVTVLTVELSQKDVLKLAKTLLKEAKGDKDLKNMLKDLGKAVGETDLSDAFSSGVEDALDELDELIDEAESGDFITIETFLDRTDAVVGRTLTVEMYGEETELYYITVTEGDAFAFEAEAGTVRISGEGKVKGGKRSGSYTLTVSGTDYVTLELKDFAQAEDGTATGTLRLIPEAALYDSLDMDTSLSPMLSSAALALTFEGDSVKLGVEAGGSALFSLTLSGTNETPKPIALPGSVSADDGQAAAGWLADLKVDGLISKLKQTGLPQAYADAVDQLADMFLGK